MSLQAAVSSSSNANVGIGDAAVRRGEGRIVTHGLGSCVAVVAFDPIARVGGLLHFQLPESSIDAERARRAPNLFGDTGVAALVRELEQAGAIRRRLRVHVAGGAQMVAGIASSEIGKRNVLAARKALWKLGCVPLREHVGGSESRGVRIDVATGEVSVRISNEVVTL